MIATQTLRPGDLKSLVLSPYVISEFCVNNIQYLVLVIEEIATEGESRENNLSEVLAPFLKDLNIINFSIADSFYLDDQFCVIVQVQLSGSEAELDLASLLTARELQVATLVAQGLPNKKVAKQLRISEWTVATHLRRIFAKLHVDSRAAMVFQCASLIQNLQQVAETEKY